MRAGVLPAALLVVLLTSACSGGSPPTLQSPASTGPPLPTPSATTPISSTPEAPPSSPRPPSSPIDPRAQPAVDAYLALDAASWVATTKPVNLGQSLSPDADYTKYSFDPIRAQFAAYVANLAQQKQAFRGQPPQPRVSVKSMALDAAPYPTVRLFNCPTLAPTWQLYEVTTGKQVPLIPPKVPGPHRVTAEVIFYQGHWGVRTVSTDLATTCSP